MTGSGAPLVWLHCESEANLPVARALARHLSEADADARVLMTMPSALVPSGPLTGDAPIEFLAAPEDTTSGVTRFIEARDPQVLVWLGPLRSATANAVARLRMPAILANLGSDSLTGSGLTWRMRSLRGPLSAFWRILVLDGATATRLHRIGFERDRVEITGPIVEDATAPPHDPNELTVMAEAIGSRPCWFAVAVVPGEIAQIVSAQRTAQRRGYRLLLLISPRDPTEGPGYGDRIAQLGLRVGVRSRGEHPHEELQAFVVDTPDEVGLWYRLAPLSFMGGTLSGPDGPSPFEAATVGSAVTHGSFTKPWTEHYARLEEAGASRKVRSGAELGAAVGELMAPERSATMAHAGWAEVTRSSETLDRMVELIEEALFAAEVL